MRILAVDYGKARIGLAITDMNKTIAYPYKTVKAAFAIEKSVSNFIDAVKERVNEIETIIIGMPVLLNGKTTDMTLEVTRFAEILKTKINIPIKFTDERLSSVIAERHLKENLKLNRKKRSEFIDSVSATILLQNYLDII